MRNCNVEDLVAPISEYATEFEEASSHGATLALKKAQTAFDKSHYTPIPILLYE